MNIMLKRAASMVTAAAILTSMGITCADAVSFETPADTVSSSGRDRLSMPSGADIALEIPEFKSLIGQDAEELNDLSPVAGYSAIEDYVDLYGEGDMLPESFDMRSEGMITSVKNQGQYGTCWTFSAAASAETSLLKNVPWIDLSEWHTAYYPYIGGNQIDIGDASLNEHLQQGGTVDIVTNLWAQWIGPVEEEKMPYGEESLFENENLVEKYKNETDYHLENAYMLDYAQDGSNRESVNSLIKQFVYSGNAVDVSFSTSGYSYLTNSAYSQVSPHKSNHSVTIAGWDDNYTASNFDGNTGAWLCRNSWDTGFGDNGYFWISYDDTSLCEFAVFELGANDEYSVNYQHDSFVPTQTMSAYDDESVNGPSYMANVFTAMESQQIEAVSTYINKPGTEYEITVYTDLTDFSDPSSGVPSAVTYGRSDITGYITVELTENVLIEAGEKFAVSVKMYCENSPFVIPLETCMLLIDNETGDMTTLGSYASYDAICEYTSENESFYSTDGIDWTDVTAENFEYTEEEKNELLEQVIAENEDMTDEQIKKYRDMFEGRDLTVIMGNISLKAFANPVNTVDFSHISGNVPTNEAVELSVKNGSDIYYSVNGGEEKLYTSAISIDENMEISATTDHVHYTSRSFTPAKAEFIDLGYYTSAKYTNYNDILYAERQDASTYNINLSGAESSVKLFIVSDASVYLNGIEVEKNEFMDAVTLNYGLNTVQFELERENRLDNTITVNIYRNPVDIDIENEVLTFEGVTVTAEDGTVFASGDSVSDYAGQILTVEADGEIIETAVPERAEVPELELDYLNETLNFIPNEIAEFAEYAVMEDPSDGDYISAEPRCIDGQNITSGMIMNKAFRVIPGETVTIRIAPGNGMFGSEPVTFVIPGAGIAPDEVPEYRSENGNLILEYSDTLEYGVTSSELTEAELESLAKRFGYDTESYVSLMTERYGISDRNELLYVLGAEWDAVFKVEADRTHKKTIAIRYYSGDSEFASKVSMYDLLYAIKGDINFDGVIDAVDASMVLAYYAASSTDKNPVISEAEYKAGDYNSDNIIDAVDASEILAYYAKIQTGKI